MSLWKRLFRKGSVGPESAKPGSGSVCHDGGASVPASRLVSNLAPPKLSHYPKPEPPVTKRQIISKLESEPNQENRLILIESLGATQDLEAIDALYDIVHYLNSKTPERQKAKEVLQRMADSPIVDSIITKLADFDENERFGAIQWLGEMKAKRGCLPICEALLKDPARSVRVRAAESLASIGDDRAIKPLCQILQTEKETELCVAVAKALGEFSAPLSVESLCTALLEGPTKVKLEAIESLGKIRNPQSVETLLQVLELPHFDTHDRGIRPQGAYILSEFGDKRALGPIFAMLKTGDEFSCAILIRALKQIPDVASIVPLIEVDARFGKSSSLVEYEVGEALEAITDPTAIGYFAQALNNQDPDIRARAVRGLGRCVVSGTIEHLCAATKDKDSTVRRYAVNALAQSDDARAIDARFEVLSDTDEEVRRSALESLSRFRDTRTIESFCIALNDANMRNYAISILEGISDHRAVEAVAAAKTALAEENRKSQIATDIWHASREKLSQTTRDHTGVITDPARIADATKAYNQFIDEILPSSDMSSRAFFFAGPLVDAIGCGLLDVVEKFLANGADVNKHGSYDTPLGAAISAKRLDIVRFLVEHGADVDVKGNQGCPPIVAAVNYNQPNIFRYLVDEGANLNSKWHLTLGGRTFQTARTTAEFKGYSEFLRLIDALGTNWTEAEASKRKMSKQRA